MQMSMTGKRGGTMTIRVMRGMRSMRGIKGSMSGIKGSMKGMREWGVQGLQEIWGTWELVWGV